MQIARESNDSDMKRPAWTPAAEAFRPCPEKVDNFVGQYRSSEGRTRFFCMRCGTSLAYAVHPMPEPWPPMLDIYLGTLDREDLDTEYMEPERHLWWNWGMEWTKRFAGLGGHKMEKHPSYAVNETVK